MKKYINACLFIVAVLVVVTTGCKKEEEGFTHDASAPITIDQLLPEKGSGGTEILINGSNFTTDTSQVKVTLNGKQLKVIGVNGKQMMVVVPKKAGSGVITVTIGSKSATSKTAFTYEYMRTVTTLAGSGVAGFANGQGTDAKFSFSGESWYRCSGIVVDDNLNVYVTDVGNHCIRKIDKDGNVTTFAGNPSSGGYQDGKGTAAKFSIPYGLTIDDKGNLYSADPGNWDIRKITPDGTATIFAWANQEPWSVAFDKKSGNVFYTSCNSPGNVYQVTTTGVTTQVISGLNYPSSMAFDNAGNLFVTIHGDHVIKKFLAGSWTGSIVAGSGVAGYLDGSAKSAKFSLPWGMSIDATNNLYIAGNGAGGGGLSNPDQSIRYIDAASYEVSTFAGSGTSGNVNGIGKSAAFSAPAGVTVDKNGTVYVLDRNNNCVRKIVSE
ncbi:IPT/TIG domain-containing protein [Pedobacter nyackensis]|uniref:NHL repeat-containing protein n=1 Tax=Pedobacter nyackensis TaxID=475255 RepID=A0A1W2EN84_9SPHI|nr:IPT/TIG domain-containing protein [Pedobacter nyackensis]SMD11197.1 NHL repeat-containing protein [Pedobacter nyackensis]